MRNISRWLIPLPAIWLSLFPTTAHAEPTLDTFDSLTGWQIFSGAPIADGALRFSYTWGEIRKTIQVPSAGTLSLSIDIDNSQTNTIGYGTPTPDSYSVAIGDQIFQSSTAHGVVSISVSKTFLSPSETTIVLRGIDNGFWQGYYGPVMDNLVIEFIPDQPPTTTATTTPPTTTTSSTSTTSTITTTEAPTTTTSTTSAPTPPPATTTEPPQTTTTTETPTTTEAPATTTTVAETTTTSTTDPDDPLEEPEPLPEPTIPETTVPETTVLAPSTTELPDDETDEPVVDDQTGTTEPQVDTPSTVSSQPEPSSTTTIPQEVAVAQVIAEFVEDIEEATPEQVAEFVEEATLEQAEELFEQLDVDTLSEEQLVAFTEAVQQATTSVRKAFEGTIDVFGSQFEDYVPTGSQVPVKTRRTLVAAGALIMAIPSVKIRKQ